MSDGASKGSEGASFSACAQEALERFAVDLRDVTCRCHDGSLLLDSLSLSIKPGECVLLCGRSGMGKTTVTKCINGLIPQFEPGIERAGDVRVQGMDPGSCEMYELAGQVGSVFQNPKSQFFNLTSNDELAFGLEAAGVDVEDIERRMRTTVASLKAERLLGRDVGKMSGGEKQSLVFASVSVVDPDVYVLDEPTANLDTEAVRVLHDQMAAVLARGKTVIVAEHRLRFMADLIDRAVLIDQGRIAREFTAAEFLSLSSDEREQLGLRATNPAERGDAACLKPPAFASEVSGNGLSLRDFCSLRKGVRSFPPVELDVPRGSVVGVTGANGSGKTTFLRAVSGLERGTEGRVVLDGSTLDRRARRRRCSLVMQDPNHQLFSDSVRGECELAAAGEAERIEEILSLLDLSLMGDRHPLALSGGQKQRLAIACALLAGREVLLLDEPTSGLDFGHMVEVSKVVKTAAAQGACVIVVTHDDEFLRRSCDCVYELKER